MKKHLFSILLLAAMFLPWSVSAQGYSCDFEDATENANWVTSEYVSTAVSHWYVGTATNNGGSNSLYISNDGGVSNAYTHRVLGVLMPMHIASSPSMLASMCSHSTGSALASRLMTTSVQVSFLAMWLSRPPISLQQPLQVVG